MTTTLGRLMVGALALALGASACAASGSEGPSSSSNQSDTQSTKSGNSEVVEATDISVQHIDLAEAKEAGVVMAATRKLGLGILEAYPKETLVTSPASAVIALSMLGTSANGEAEDQLSLLLGAPEEERDAAVNALMGSLSPHSAPVANIDPQKLPERPQIHLANQLVLNIGTKINDTYLDSLREWYDAGVLETDLATEEGFVPINQWVEENTAGLIDKSALQPDPSLRMILQNAVVFAAKWQSPFLAANTSPGEFHAGNGDTVTADFMNAVLPLRYAEVDGWKMVELPYGQEGQVVATYLLPPLDTPPASITLENLEALEKGLSEAVLSVSLPKLDLKSTADLTAPIQRAGLTAVFSDSPPALGYISKNETLMVSAVLQQGRFRLDEEGTLAAATTEVAVVVSSMLMPDTEDFIVDRPHIIFIKDPNVGWDLFQVLVNDPSAIPSTGA